MYYHMLIETEVNGKPAYKLAKLYKRWASKPMMEWLLNQEGTVWVIAIKKGFIYNFGSIGNPNGLCWTNSGWQSQPMPVLPVASN